MNDFDELGDHVSIEIDRRKLEGLINSGKVTREELRRAPIIEMSSNPKGHNAFYETDKPGNNIVGVTCGMCSAEFKTMKQFERHLVREHITE